MNNFEFYSPTYFVFGKEKENLTGGYIKKFGGTKVLLHYGGGSAIRSGLLERVKASLDKEKIAYIELGGVKPNPRDGLVYEGIELCKKENIDFVMGIGGGSVLDSAKAIAAGAVYDGDFWDFFDGKPVEKALPLGTIVTIAATGSEASPDTIITKEEGMYKRAADGDVIKPVFSIMNPELTMTLPAYQTACGITDMMTHVMERYFSNTKDVEVTDRLAEAILKAIIKEGKRVMAEPDNYEARANIMWAGTIAHNNTCGIGRDQDWGTHHLEHELSALYDCAHGAGLAIMMPACIQKAYAFRKQCQEKTVEIVKPYWKGRSTLEKWNVQAPEEVNMLRDNGAIYIDRKAVRGFGETSPGYAYIIQKGMRGLKEMIEERRSRLDITVPGDWEKDCYLRA